MALLSKCWYCCINTVMADSKDAIRSCEDYKDKRPFPVSAMESNDNRPSSINNRITPTRENAYWFAQGGVDIATNNASKCDNKEAQLQKEREERIRLFREQQEEERVRRLKELESSFELARKFREQQEEERKRKIEEMRIKENERRQQVEERKRLIWEAEQERKEAILRRNLEREARIEARRNAQRNSMSFAFGSSTPRTFDLDLAAIGNSPLGCSLMSSVSARRSEEKEVVGGVKRATSACSLDKKAEDIGPYNLQSNRAASAGPDDLNIAKLIAFEHMNSAETKACLTINDDYQNRRFSLIDFSSGWLVGSGALVGGEDLMSRSMISLSSAASRGRRRTDLTPVMPRERSVTPHTVSRGKDSSRSPSRPQSSMSGRSEISVSSSQASSVNLRPRPPVRKPRPVSIAGSTVDKSTLLEKQTKSRELSGAALLGPKPYRPKTSNIESVAKVQPSAKKPVPPPKSAHVIAKAKAHPVPTKDNLRKNVRVTSNENNELPIQQDLQSESKTEPPSSPEISMTESVGSKMSTDAENHTDSFPNSNIETVSNTSENKVIVNNQENSLDSNDSAQVKPRITSEEEAKAAIAEKRRLAREQAEREAELERQRQEEIRRQEEEKRIQEELEQKRLEEEQIRLAELHRKLEQEKLQKAIEEQKQRELEEMAKKEEEAKLRQEREEQDRKAREEAEKQRLELEERLRKEELERAERKKRVEQIMSRTRNKSNAAANKTVTSPSSETTQKVDSQSVESRVNSSITESTNVIMNSTVTPNGNSQMNNYGQNTTPTPPLNLDILMTHSNVKNGYHHSDNIEQSFIKNSNSNCVPNRTPNSDTISPLQTNGYSSHEEMSITSSPEDRSEKSNSSGGLLLNLQSAQLSPPNVVPRGHNNQLIDISGNSSNDSYLIHPDVVNSNLVSSSDPFHSFDTNLPKKQETAITDLLS